MSSRKNDRSTSTVHPLESPRRDEPAAVGEPTAVGSPIDEAADAGRPARPPIRVSGARFRNTVGKRISVGPGGIAVAMPPFGERANAADVIDEAFGRRPKAFEHRAAADAHTPGEPALRRKLAFSTYLSRDRLTKQYWPLPDGTVDSISGTRFSVGSYRVIAIDGTDLRAMLVEFGRHIDSLSMCQAIGIGVPIDGATEGEVTTKRRFLAGGAGIPRAKSHFGWPPELGLVFCDGDEYNGLYEILCTLYPPLRKVAFLVRRSASASIVVPATGMPLKSGEHGFAPIDEPAKVKAVLEAFIRLAWCCGTGKGQGVLRLSKDGKVLVRGPVDISVASPERLIYEGEAVVAAGLETLARTSSVIGGDGVLVADDLIAFADRVAPEELYRKRLSEAADEPEFRVRREELRAQYRKVHVKAAVARGVPRIQAEKRYDEATRRGSTTIGEREYVPLTPEHVLYRPDGRAFTVADIQADPAAYHGIECADPIEGLDYQSKNCAIIYSDGDAAGRIRIYSRAHSDAFCYVAPLDPETPWDDVFEDVGLDVVEDDGKDDDTSEGADTTTADDQGPVWNPFVEAVGPEFPFDVLPDYLRDWSEDRHLSTGADRSAYVMAELTALGSTCDHRIKLVLKDDATDPFMVHSRLWLLLVGDPSFMKSPVIKAVTRGLRERDARAMARYKKDLDAWKTTYGGKKDRPPAPEQPYLHICDATTTTRLMTMCMAYPRGVLIETGEFAQFIGDLDRFNGNKKTGGDKAFWNTVYDGGPYLQARQGSGEESGKSDRFAQNLSAGLLAAVQLDKLLAMGELEDDGFLQRLVPLVMRRPGPEHDDHDSRPAASTTRARVLDRIAALSPANFAAGRIRLSPEARVVRNRMRELRAAMQTANEPSKAFGAFCGKLENVFGALCIVLHMIERSLVERPLLPTHVPDAPEFVSGDVAARAARIVDDFILPHGLAFYEALAGSPADARAIAVAILGQEGDVLTLRDLQRGPRAMRGAKDLQAIQKLLFPFESGGWLTPVSNRPGNRKWHIAKGLRERFAKEREEYLAHIEAIRSKLGVKS